jgi:LacI family transcriptional regulator
VADRRQAQRAQPRRRVGIKQVAEEAGLRTAAASRVLSNTGYASEASRARVIVAADHLGYQPDALAR